MLPHEIATPRSVYPRDVDRALSFHYPTTWDTEYFDGIEIIMCT
jgi:hypothetical protein